MTMLEEFENELVSAWDLFPHRFRMPKARGNAAAWVALAKDANSWQCSSLSDAACQYCWDTIAKLRGGFTSEELRHQLQEALAQENDSQLACVCIKTFRWGGVGRGKNKDWLTNKVTAGELVLSIRAATQLLLDPCSDLRTFNGEDLLMNSSMTKVYALADDTNRLVIYDGRVGAALGMLVVRFLKARNIVTVPEDLAFAWGGRRDESGLMRRDPSTHGYSFPMLWTEPRSHQKYAILMRRVSGIIQRVAHRLNIAPQDFERALFMVGYDVSSPLAAPYNVRMSHCS
jgi:hypothetical protein